MLPRLQAQEHLDAIRVQGLAFSGYSKADSEAMMSELRDKAAGAARGDDDARPARATPEMLAAMGIGMAPAASQGTVSHG